MKRFGKRRTAQSKLEMPEICLTPLIDTALTLLVIFMVTTPMIQNSIKIDLPEGTLKEASAPQQEIVVSIDKQDTIYVNNMPVGLPQLAEAIQKAMTTAQQEHKKPAYVWVAVDKNKSCPAATLISVIETVKKIGGINVAIATKQSMGAHSA